MTSYGGTTKDPQLDTWLVYYLLSDMISNEAHHTVDNAKTPLNIEMLTHIY